MNIFSSLSYRDIIKKIILERKKIDSSYNFQNLANVIRVQKTYLSNCLKGKADLNLDQLYMVCEFLKLNSDQTQYLELLLNYERSGLKDRRDKLLSMIKAMQAKYDKTDQYISARKITVDSEGVYQYYLDPIHQIVHVSLAIEKYRTNLQLLARDINVPVFRIMNSITTLEKLGIISKSGKEVKVIQDSLHLPADNPIYKTWRNELKNLSMQKLRNLKAESSYSFAVVFAATEDTRRFIQGKFFDFLKEIEPVAQAAESENAYYMNFDLFPWMEN